MTGLKLFATGTTAAATGLSVLGTAAVNTFADYEQLVGGVETLFGASGKSISEYAASVGKKEYEVYHEHKALMDAQNEVLHNASIAYETAGLSANDYMETVTGIAAALKQSTGSEMEAALAADQAIIDMADNANKMGNSMESIVNAYQGFAKGQYDLLDNLRLGYGGNATEMARLINDSGVLGDAMIDLGDKQNIGAALAEVGLSKMYEAIHVIQTELGITGTTADEAFTTITGSLSAMKASWENLLVGVADDTQDFDTLVNNFVDSAVIVAENLLPRMGTAIQGSFNLVTQLAPVIAEQIPGMVQNIVPELLQSGIDIVLWIAQGIEENVPSLLEKGYELLENLVEGFVEGIPEYLPLALDFIQQFGDSLAEKASIFVQKGCELLSRLADGIVSAIPILIEKVPTIISTFANIINDNFPTILLTGAKIIGKLVVGILSAIPEIISNLPKIVQAIIDTIMAFQWLNLGKNIMEFFKNGIQSMKTKVVDSVNSILKNIQSIINNLPGYLSNIAKNAMNGFANAIRAAISSVSGASTSIFNAIKNVIGNLPTVLGSLAKSAMSALSNGISNAVGSISNIAGNIASAVSNAVSGLPDKMLSIGGDIVKGLWNGISNMTGWITDKILGFASGIINAAKEGFDEHSPSKEFEYIGEMCVAGYDQGVEGFMDTSNMTNKIKSGLTAMKNSIEGQRYASGSYGYGEFNQTINIYKEISTADEIARTIRVESKWGLMKGVPVGA